jgi:hypothetical protein
MFDAEMSVPPRPGTMAPSSPIMPRLNIPLYQLEGGVVGLAG